MLLGKRLQRRYEKKNSILEYSSLFKYIRRRMLKYAIRSNEINYGLNLKWQRKKNGCICMSAINNSSWRKIRNEPKINRIEGLARHGHWMRHSNHLQPTLDERRCFDVRIRSFFCRTFIGMGEWKRTRRKDQQQRMQLVSCRHPLNRFSSVRQLSIQNEMHWFALNNGFPFDSFCFSDSVYSVWGHVCVFRETR